MTVLCTIDNTFCAWCLREKIPVSQLFMLVSFLLFLATYCSACPCNDHADQCYFNQTTGRIACLACRHNTAGVRCEECSARYRRDNDVALNDTDACIRKFREKRMYSFCDVSVLAKAG